MDRQESERNEAQHNGVSSSNSSAIEHLYVEVGGELLSKPNALSDLIEQQGFPRTIIYCNTPSDTDLLEVLLKKRGIGATKLIGFVPQAKIARALERLISHEVTAIVVTDIAARSLTLSDFDLAINYSVQNDSELYLQRCGLSTGPQTQDGASAQRGSPKRVVTLVAPLDVANFHFLKKSLGMDLTKLEAPNKTDLLKARAQQLAFKASNSAIQQDEGYQDLAKLILEGADARKTVAYLAHAALEIIPQLSSDLEKAVNDRENTFEDEEGDQGGNRGGYDRGDRGERGDRGGDRRRGARGRDRGGDRGDRSYRDRGGYDSRQGGRNSGGRDGGFNQDDDGGSYQQQDFGDSNGEDMPRGERGRGRGPRRDVIRTKEDRLYIGHGSKQGFSKDKFLQAIQQECGLTGEELKRFVTRDLYSFADLPEELTSKVIDSLRDKEVGGIDKFFVTRALTITTTKEVEPSENGNGDHSMEAEDNGGGEEEMMS